MKIIYLNGQRQNIEENIVSAIGFFDGLHIGHHALVDEVFHVAKKRGYKTALMTFDHHPLYVLGYNEKEEWLMSMDDRIELLNDLGMDYLFIIQFDRQVASLSPELFMQKYLFENKIRHVVCGFDFKFGFKNSGNHETLKNSQLFDVSVIEEVLYDNKKISSSRIREELNSGHIKEVNTLLGRAYSIKGEVIKGRQIGRQIGFPTANISYGQYHLPCFGVYAVKVVIDKNVYYGMCNIGFNPTFSELNKPSLEVHIFDFNEDIYGKEVKVEFYDLIRLEKKFNHKDELIEQLNKDKIDIIKRMKTQ